MNNVILSLGGNIGDKDANFRNVLSLIEQKIGIINKKSSIHKSKAWGFESNDEFYNQVIEVRTLLSAEELLSVIWVIERQFGRKRGTENEELIKYKQRLSSENPIYTSREMDIDILYFNDENISTELLTIPHPLINQRDFILIPLKEIRLR